MFAGAGNGWVASERQSSASETHFDNAKLGLQASKADQPSVDLPNQTRSSGKVEACDGPAFVTKPLFPKGGARRPFKSAAVSGFQSASALAEKDIEQAERSADTKLSRKLAFQQSLPDSEVGSSGVDKDLCPCPPLGTQLTGPDLAMGCTHGNHRKLQKMMTHLAASSPQQSGVNGSTFAPCPDKVLYGPERMTPAEPSLEGKESANCKMDKIPAYFPESVEPLPKHAEQVQSSRISPHSLVK